MFNLRKNRKGFTLIELIIVIAIIAILAAIAIPSFIGITDQANKKVAVANANNIATAVNAYNALNPNNEVPSPLTYDGTSALLDGSTYDLWPKGLTSEQFTAALAYIDYTNNVATVVNIDS